MTVDIEPAFWQNRTYQILSVAGVLLLALGFYRRRLRQVTAEAHLRYAERLAERTRIARELHDTLLQSFQGVLLKFSTVPYLIRDRPDEAIAAQERAIEQARQAIAEGRDAVQGLRSSTVLTNDLARAVAALGEAVRNALQHAEAGKVEVDIHYDPRFLRVRVRDNGKGIDPQVLAAGGREGHHGLPGMQERAELAGGKLTVWSERNAGTEVEFTIPASVAYTKGHGARRLTSPGKETG